MSDQGPTPPSEPPAGGPRYAGRRPAPTPPAPQGPPVPGPGDAPGVPGGPYQPPQAPPYQPPAQVPPAYQPQYPSAQRQSPPVGYGQPAFSASPSGFPSAPERPTREYKQWARSPIAPMIIFFVSIPAAIVAMIAIASTIETRTSTRVIGGTTYLVEETDGQGQSFAILLVSLVLALVWCWWIGRLGSNSGAFQNGLPLAVVLPNFAAQVIVYLIALTVGGSNGLLIFLGIISFIVLIWPMRQLSHGLASAANGPDWLGLLGWLPVLGIITSPIALVYWLVMPIVVTVMQDIGIRKDKAAQQAYQDARRYAG